MRGESSQEQESGIRRRWWRRIRREGSRERGRQSEPVGGEGAQTALCLLFKHTFLATLEGEKYLSSEGRWGGSKVSGH